MWPGLSAKIGRQDSQIIFWGSKEAKGYSQRKLSKLIGRLYFKRLPEIEKMLTAFGHCSEQPCCTLINTAKKKKKKTGGSAFQIYSGDRVSVGLQPQP